MKYLKKFQTQAAYNAAESSLILPNVSLIAEGNKVEYNRNTPTPSHEYVEIGGIKWATMNLGANSVTDGGLYFQWGDTQGYTAAQVGSGEGQKYFGLEDYKWTNDGGSTFSKYNSTDGKTELDEEDDAVTAAWGGNWRMPTTAEFQALGEAVNTAWTNDYQGSGVSGFVCTDKTDSSKVLFFPGVGMCSNGNVLYDGSTEYGVYAYSSSSSRHSGNIRLISTLKATSEGSVSWNNAGFSRWYGITIRGILDE